MDPNGIDAEDHIEFLIRAELKIKRLSRKKHRNCRCCKESLSKKKTLFKSLILLFFLSLAYVKMLRRCDFKHCSVFHLILNLWTYWFYITRGRCYKKLFDYIEWNLFYIRQRRPPHYLPFEIVQDVLFRPDNLYPASERCCGHFLQSLNYWFYCLWIVHNKK